MNFGFHSKELTKESFINIVKELIKDKNPLETIVKKIQIEQKHFDNSNIEHNLELLEEIFKLLNKNGYNVLNALDIIINDSHQDYFVLSGFTVEHFNKLIKILGKEKVFFEYLNKTIDECLILPERDYSYELDEIHKQLTKIKRERYKPIMKHEERIDYEQSAIVQSGKWINRRNVNQLNKEGFSLLHEYCMKGDYPSIRYLIDECNASVDLMVDRGEDDEFYGFRPVHFLCKINDAKTLDYLIRVKNVDINTGKIRTEETEEFTEEEATITEENYPPPLFVATKYDSFDVLSNILKCYNCKMNVKYKNQNVLFYFFSLIPQSCFIESKFHTLFILYDNILRNDIYMQSNSILQEKDELGNSIFNLACNYHHFYPIYIIESTPFIKMHIAHTRNNEGDYPIHTACRKGWFNTVKYLFSILEAKDYLVINNRRETPLHVAVEHGYDKIVQLYCSKFQFNSLQITDKFGLTPLDIAKRDNDYSSQEYLMEIKPSIDDEDINNHVETILKKFITPYSIGK